MAARTRGVRLGVYHFSHALVRWEPTAGTLPFFVKVNDGWFKIKQEFVPGPDDFILGALYDAFFSDTGMTVKYWGETGRQMRQSGAEMVWTLADYRRDQVAALPPNELFISQHWRYGDAVVTVPQYDVNIIPTSGVLTVAVFQMIQAEMATLAV